MLKINTAKPQTNQPPLHLPPGLLSAPQASASDRVGNAAIRNPLQALDELVQWEANPRDNSRLRVRWSQDAMPLTVWIEPMPSDHSHPFANVSALLFQTMRQWENASQGLVRFSPLATGLISAAKPHITVHWSKETVLGRDYEVGHTNRSVQGTQIRQAEITLILNPLIDARLGPRQRQQRLIATILHETGHALGLEHSESGKDVMHHRGCQHTCLSANDATRLVQLYQAGSLKI